MNDAVLIVDDSLTVRMDLADALEEAGFRSLPCATLAEARSALGRETIAVAILDLLLPDGDGIELLREIRAAPATARTPVLMLSSEAEVGDRIRGLLTGADDYVGKPYDTGYVVGRARDLVRGNQAAPRTQVSTVLVIDDSPTFRDALRRGLEGAGHQVLSAANGEEGLRVAANHLPAAIIVDGLMPGIDGGTVIRRVRLDAAMRATPCLLLTAAEGQDAELRALEAGADAFVRKEADLDVILARLAAMLRAAPTERRHTASLLGPKRILAVDDSMTYLMALASVLRLEGYDVVMAHSGEAALEMLAVQPVDCILLDLRMPGLGGKETCRRIKASPATREVPLIIITALEEREAMIDGLITGADDYIQKSSDFEVLKARVRAQLRRKQFEDEHRRIRDDLHRSELMASEARAARHIAETKAALAEELERKNAELEAFSYSVSHDLRAPLRAIDGFSQVLLEDHAERLDADGRDCLDRVRAAARRMNELIDDLLQLSQVSRADLHRGRVDLSEIARAIADQLQGADPRRTIAVDVQDGLFADSDGRLLRVALENLMGNAWKFTAGTAQPRVEFGATEREGEPVYFVRDNGAGFDMAHAHKLFNPFQRLHGESEFPGTGIGLATVRRIVERHGGRVWAEGAVGLGATVFFRLPPPRSPGIIP